MSLFPKITSFLRLYQYFSITLRSKKIQCDGKEENSVHKPRDSTICSR